MDILRRLFSGKSKVEDPYSVRRGRHILVFVRCNNCQEQIPVRMSTTSEVQTSLEPTAYHFFVRKYVTGKKCWQKLELTLGFDRNYKLLQHTITGEGVAPKNSQKSGGTLIPRTEYKEP